jgi:hypothetical protein
MNAKQIREAVAAARTVNNAARQIVDGSGPLALAMNNVEYILNELRTIRETLDMAVALPAARADERGEIQSGCMHRLYALVDEEY